MRLEDAQELLAVYGDADAMQYLTPDVPTSVAEAERWVRSKIDLYESDDQLSLWTVIERAGGRIVGDVGLQHEDYGWGPEVGIGGRGNRSFWHKGLAVEAAKACLGAGFGALNLQRIGAETAPDNVPAQRALTRLGMRRTASNADGWSVYFISRDEWFDQA
ncbi:GNAT family N-acetyltransferase [Prescottella defluvii]